MSDDSKIETEAGPNGQPEAAVAIADSDKLMRFRRYFGKPVALQLRTPVLQLDYSGQNMATRGAEYGLLALAMLQTEEGKVEPVGTTSFLPRVRLQASDDGEHLLAWIQSPSTGALIEINLEPEQVVFVTSVLKLPSPIVRPHQN